jgi:hypothetical protein
MHAQKEANSSVKISPIFQCATYILNPSPPLGGIEEHAVKLEKHNKQKNAEYRSNLSQSG